MLAPRNEVGPHVDVVPEVGKTISPRREDALELLRTGVEVRVVRSGEAVEDLLRFLQFYKLLEDLEEGDVGLRNDFGEVVPFAKRELDPFVAQLVERFPCVVRRLR